MTPTVICEFNKNPSELIRLTLSEFGGRQYLDLRIFYDAGQAEAPDWKPSKKGLCLSVDLLDEVLEGIKAAMVAAGVDDGQRDSQGGEDEVRAHYDQEHPEGDPSDTGQRAGGDFRG